MFNPFVPSFTRDPYPAYAALRAEEPVHYSAALQLWVVTGYAACEQILRDPGTFSSDPFKATGPLARQLAGQRRSFPLGETPSVLSSDPPAHTRLRGIVSRALTPRVAEELRPRIEEITQSLLDEAGPGPFDVVTGLAQPLPIIVIAELLGVPPADRELFKQWSVPIAATTNVINSAETMEAARRATQELIEYLEPLVEARRLEPRDDLLTALVQAEEARDRLTHDELLAFCILLLIAGHETTTNLIANGTLALLHAPQQAAAMRAGAEAVPAAVEELLRYDSPVQAVGRVAVTDTALSGQVIAAGSSLLVAVGAANRDPARFPDPDRLDVARADNRHLSFGLGPHFCLGAPLARMEAAVAFAALLRRFPELRPAEEAAPRVGTLALRGTGRLLLETD